MPKNKAAVSLGRLGGNARAAKLSRKQRSAISAHAARNRWEHQRQHLIIVFHELTVGHINTRRIVQQMPLVKQPGQYYLYREGDELLSLDELASRLRISKTTAYGLTRKRAHVRSANPLPCFKVGKELRFNWSAVVAWLDALEKGGNV